MDRPELDGEPALDWRQALCYNAGFLLAWLAVMWLLGWPELINAKPPARALLRHGLGRQGLPGTGLGGDLA